MSKVQEAKKIIEHIKLPRNFTITELTNIVNHTTTKGVHRNTVVSAVKKLQDDGFLKVVSRGPRGCAILAKNSMIPDSNPHSTKSIDFNFDSFGQHEIFMIGIPKFIEKCSRNLEKAKLLLASLNK